MLEAADGGYDGLVWTCGKQLDWTVSVEEVLRGWPTDRQVMLLHTGRAHPRWAKRSILGQPSGCFRILRRPDDDRLQSVWTGDAPQVDPARFTHQPFDDLRYVQSCGGDRGLWIGYLSYDLGRAAERLPAHPCVDRDYPIVELAYCKDYLVHDSASEVWRAFGDWREAALPDLNMLNQGAAQRPIWTMEAMIPAVPRSDYEAAVHRIRQYIGAGDVFQVNLAQRFTTALRGDYPKMQRGIYDRMMQISPAWYGAYLELAHDDSTTSIAPGQPRRALASISPELFLELDDQGVVVTRPIKGTRPTSCDPLELSQSAKDQAELTMIVDLLRNDLGRVCDYGSVRVTDPRCIETHPTVHHGVATIEGRLHLSRDLASLLRAMTPGGSVTGAPKIRAMQIIDELEPTARGPYCGAIGWLNRKSACFNVAIRTMMLEQVTSNTGRADVCVGGGIVADSDPASEYQETLDKAAAMFAALQTGGCSVAKVNQLSCV